MSVGDQMMKLVLSDCDFWVTFQLLCSIWVFSSAKQCNLIHIFLRNKRMVPKIYNSDSIPIFFFLNLVYSNPDLKLLTTYILNVLVLIHYFDF